MDTQRRCYSCGTTNRVPEREKIWICGNCAMFGAASVEPSTRFPLMRRTSHAGIAGACEHSVKGEISRIKSSLDELSRQMSSTAVRFRHATDVLGSVLGSWLARSSTELSEQPSR